MKTGRDGRDVPGADKRPGTAQGVPRNETPAWTRRRNRLITPQG